MYKAHNHNNKQIIIEGYDRKANKARDYQAKKMHTSTHIENKVQV